MHSWLHSCNSIHNMVVFRHPFRPGFWISPVSFLVSSGLFSPVLRWPECVAGCSLPANAELKICKALSSPSSTIHATFSGRKKCLILWSCSGNRRQGTNLRLVVPALFSTPTLILVAVSPIQLLIIAVSSGFAYTGIELEWAPLFIPQLSSLLWWSSIFSWKTLLEHHSKEIIWLQLAFSRSE